MRRIIFIFGILGIIAAVGCTTPTDNDDLVLVTEEVLAMRFDELELDPHDCDFISPSADWVCDSASDAQEAWDDATGAGYECEIYRRPDASYLVDCIP